MKGPAAKVEDYVETVADRDFNDLRYDIDTSKLQALGWAQKVDFDEGFQKTVEWYSKVALPSGFWPSIRMEINGSDIAHPLSPQ